MRPLKKLIDIQALSANWQHLSNCVFPVEMIAVVKANAYGHDVKTIASSLKNAKKFAVACIEEAIELRNLGITQSIMLLEGVFSKDELELCQQYQLEIVLHNKRQLQWLQQSMINISFWLKVDSGMHRLGFSIDEVNQLVKIYTNHQDVRGVISHFACADETNLSHTRWQLDQLNKLVIPSHWQRCFANSAAIFSLQDARFDWVRPGIMLYGISPFESKSAQSLGLSPVMTLQTEIIDLHYLHQGETAGYGQGFIAPQNGYIATIAGGYGDGLSRQIPSGEVPVLINGQIYYLVGLVAMDMSLVWLGNDARSIGEKVIFFGKGLPIENVAKAARTIPYTLTTMLTSRVHLEVTHG